MKDISPCYSKFPKEPTSEEKYEDGSESARF